MAVSTNRKRVAIRYTAEDGQNYSLTTSRNHAVAVGATGATNEPAFPRGWKPRTVNLVQINATGPDKHLQVVAPDKNAAIWKGTTTTLPVAPYGTYEICGRSGERRSLLAPNWDGNQNPPNAKVLVRYQSDDGNFYLYATTRAHAFAVSAPVPQGNEKPFPKRWTPRHYNLKSTDLSGADQKLVLVEPNPNSAAYKSDAGYRFTVPTLGTFDSTGRKEESRPRSAPRYQ